MRVLITGGAGFFGFHMANKLIQHGHEVRLLDIADYIEEDYIDPVEFHKGDVRDRKVVDRVMRGVDAVIHAAAALPLWPRREIFSVNVEGTRTVLESAQAHGVPRVVFISSTAVYGIPRKHPILEDDPLQGVGPYGESKIQAERICQSFRERGLTVTVIRPKTFIGPGRLGVFQILFDWVERGKPIPIIGSGRNRYQLLDVDDLTDAIVLALTVPAEQANDTFNIGAERFGTVREDVQALCDHAGTGARVWPLPARPVKAALALFEALHLSPLYRWVYGTADKDSFVAIDRAKAKLGWRPRYSNAESLIRTYEWYRAHRAELAGKVGVTHRVAWDQGILRVIRDLLP
ncbi:NAD-dependent epimerase/dehydratase family protein [Thermoflexus sp.]|jgi:nucleoside-diphosphate-sugar epimerase|uniref:NAD-dependent epimerase/dehydratase family protein n=1 Tax=Thermoflexus sp. TaxID=1969742 RepID=UPI003C0F458C